MTTEQQALERARRAAGSWYALHKALNVSKQTIYNWRDNGRVADPTKVLEIERRFGVSRHELRPDIYPE